MSYLQNLSSLKKFNFSLFVSAILTILSYLIIGFPAELTIIGAIELLAVFTSYSSVILCVLQSRINYPIGVATTALYSLLFMLNGQIPLAIFNLYLVVSLIYGYFRWGPDGKTIPVSMVERPMWIGYLGFAGIIWFGLQAVIHFGVPIPTPEIWLIVLQAVAQLLLDNKKIETWAVWAIVNIASIPYYFSIGLPLVAIQYIFFLLNTIYGFYMWRKSVIDSGSSIKELREIANGGYDE